MSKKANTTLIGAFVLGAIALVVLGVLTLGAGRLFRKTEKYVMFFEGSVKGLQVGAPVVIRGVEVGQVTEIAIKFDPARLQATIPVYVEIDPSKIVVTGAGAPLGGGRYLRQLIDLGARAQLQTQSFVTGMLAIDLDLRPKTPARFVGAEKAYPEIPTVPSDLQQLSKKLEEAPLQEIATELRNTLAGLDKLVNSPRLEATVTSIGRLVDQLDRFARNADAKLARVSSRAGKLMTTVDGEIRLVGASARETSQAAHEALDEARATLAEAKQIAAQNANVGYQLSRSIEQMTALVRSLRSVSDYLDRHPEALVRGKGGP